MDDEVLAETDPGALAQRIQSGDQRAETELIRRYGPRIEFILRRRCRDPELAADLRQEALIVVLERLRGEGLAEPDKLPSFICQTAVNLAIGEARTYYRRNTHADWEAVMRAADRQPLLADMIEQDELCSWVRRMLKQLRKPRDQQILRRYYLTQESKETICQSLDITLEHFDRVLHRARTRFRRLVEKSAAKKSVRK